jgi:hypothetical protein
MASLDLADASALIPHPQRFPTADRKRSTSPANQSRLTPLNSKASTPPNDFSGQFDEWDEQPLNAPNPIRIRLLITDKSSKDLSIWQTPESRYIERGISIQTAQSEFGSTCVVMSLKRPSELQMGLGE